MLLLLLLLVTLIGLISLECFGFSSSFNPTERTYSFPPSDPSGRLIYVKAFETQEATAAALCHDLWSHAKNTLSNREFFHVAVPGGSVLKMLSGLSKYREELWWDRVCLYYVNHKVVSAEDSSSTHMKAQKYFLNEIPSIRVASLSGGLDADQELALYTDRIASQVPFDTESQLPVFDYMLLGMGSDGHIGSLYPNRSEWSVTDKTVLRVDKKQPSSITLSLPVMRRANRIVLAATGEDKAEAVYKVARRSQSVGEFPVIGVTSDWTENAAMKSSALNCFLDYKAASRL